MVYRRLCGLTWSTLIIAIRIHCPLDLDLNNFQPIIGIAWQSGALNGHIQQVYHACLCILVDYSWTAGSTGGAGWWLLYDVLSVLMLAIVSAMSLVMVSHNASGVPLLVVGEYCLHPGWPQC